MSPVAVTVIAVIAGIAGFLTGWTLGVIVRLLLEEPHDVWEDE